MLVGLLATADWSFLEWVGVIVKVAIGLGAVIFVHELGHFLVAKACGVKCEKFMIGFDIGGYRLSRRLRRDPLRHRHPAARWICENARAR